MAQNDDSPVVRDPEPVAPVSEDKRKMALILGGLFLFIVVVFVIVRSMRSGEAVKVTE